MQCVENSSLGPSGEAFVQPEVIDSGIRDQIASPRVSQFVGDDVDQGAVACDYSWREKCHARILHAAEREGRRKNQHVVPSDAGNIN